MISAGPHPTTIGPAMEWAPGAIAAPLASTPGRRGAKSVPGRLEALRVFGTTRVAPAAVLVVGLTLRLGAVGFGHEWLTFQPDKHANIPIALGLSWDQLNPHAFYYPDLFWYLLFALNWEVYWVGRELGLVADWTQYRSLFDNYPVPFFLLGRMLSVAVGTATIGLVYGLGRRLYSPADGLVAAAFLAAGRPGGAGLAVDLQPQGAVSRRGPGLVVPPNRVPPVWRGCGPPRPGSGEPRLGARAARGGRHPLGELRGAVLPRDGLAPRGVCPLHDPARARSLPVRRHRAGRAGPAHPAAGGWVGCRSRWERWPWSSP
jgi:hypothetical protein